MCSLLTDGTDDEEAEDEAATRGGGGGGRLVSGFMPSRRDFAASTSCSIFAMYSSNSCIGSICC